MPNHSLHKEESERRYKAIVVAIEAGYAPPGVSVPGGGIGALSAAADACGVNRRTFGSWWHTHGHSFPPLSAASVAGVAQIGVAASPSRGEIRDASFWRTRAAKAEREIAEIEHLAEELAGFRDSVAPRHVDWAREEADRKGRSALIAFVSDVHMGEKIAEDEIDGINAFDPSICEARLKRYFNAAIEVGSRMTEDTECRGAVLLLGGDMISGDIHAELRETNSLTSQEQALAVTECLAAGVRGLLGAFGRVRVVSVPGNHSRVTEKPHAKLYSRASYDTLIASILAAQFKGGEHVTFTYGASKDQAVNLFGFEHFLTHGDKMGTSGGQGFAGAFLPIVRGAKKIEAQQASIGRKPDYIWHGHYHTTGNAGNIFSNGSVPGYSEYASQLRVAVEPPQQWLAVAHSTWGVRERVPIRLEDQRRTLPRISVRAA